MNEKSGLESQTDLPTTGDLVDHHRDMSVRHARCAQDYLGQLETAGPASRRDNLLNQQIGVHLKLSDVHARLALATANSTPSPTVVNNSVLPPVSDAAFGRMVVRAIAKARREGDLR